MIPVAPRIGNEVSYVTTIKHGQSSRPVAPRIGNEVSYVTTIKHASHFVWQVQHLVKFKWHFSWQAQYLVKV